MIKMSVAFKTLLVTLVLVALAAGAGQSRGLIGPYLPDAPNGIAFIDDDQAAFLVRFGWLTRRSYMHGYKDIAPELVKFVKCTPDSSTNEVVWKVKDVTVRMDWSFVGKDCAVGKVTADGAVRIALEACRRGRRFPRRIVS